MKFPTKLIKGTLIKRYKRFLADVTLTNGDEITAHCANPGAMLGLKAPGQTVWLSPATNPKRKLKYSWELTEIKTENATQNTQENTLVGINTSHPNKLIEEAIHNGTITQLQNYPNLKREVKYGENSRIDILLQSQTAEQTPACYVEVKNVHLVRKPGLAEFPDSVTTRGSKHLKELANMREKGQRAVMIYCIQREDATAFSLAQDIDPTYAATFEDAIKAGVEAYAYRCKITPKEMTVRKEVPIK